ncbi:bombesin receptor subtype-3 [Anolis carolinensis]|uniref:bombesin receptor subtype-3 n=1 Tax=Anolis carolinensis TaxID=28377 RepID=UPI002F2B488F
MLTSHDKMSRASLVATNAILYDFTNATELLPHGESNHSVEETWFEEVPLGLGILCVIYVTYAAIISVGLLGNLILIKVFFKIKSMQTVPNIFITSLAFGDVILLLTCVPVDAACYMVETWLFGRVGCKMLSFIQRTSVGVSVFTLTVLSADRYKAIVKPLELQRADAVLRTCLKATCVWVISMLLAVPEAVSSDLYAFHLPEKNSSFETCAPYPVSERVLQEAHSLVCFLIFYIVPLAIISIYYFLIARTLYQSTSNMPAEEQGHARKQIESRKRVAKTVLVLVGLFALCWLPNHILYLYRSFTYHASIDTSAFHLVATIFSRALAFSNSCVNPFALYWLSKGFRQHFKKEVLCCKRKAPATRRPSITQNYTPTRTMSVTGSEISVTFLTDYSITKEEESV